MLHELMKYTRSWNFYISSILTILLQISSTCSTLQESINWTLDCLKLPQAPSTNKIFFVYDAGLSFLSILLKDTFKEILQCSQVQSISGPNYLEKDEARMISDFSDMFTLSMFWNQGGKLNSKLNRGHNDRYLLNPHGISAPIAVLFKNWHCF